LAVRRSFLNPFCNAYNTGILLFNSALSLALTSSSFSFSLLSTSWAVIANFGRLVGAPSSMLELLSVEGEFEDITLLYDNSLSLL
jgi:hypothetical protein